MKCTHCNSTFRFVDHSQKTVLRGKIAHNCPSCGAPVKDGEGFVCTKCGVDWLCQRCVKKFGQRYVCSGCLNINYVISGTSKICPKCSKQLQYDKQKNQWQCYHPCFKYITHVCPECGSEMKFIPKYNEFYCYNCKKYPACKPQTSNYANSCPKMWETTDFCSTISKMVLLQLRHLCLINSCANVNYD
jgi:predicted RNA-binding Zn-ribbon protein involved in translation (DUF1610 family)